MPGALVMESSEAGIDAARQLKATAVEYSKPPAEYAAPLRARYPLSLLEERRALTWLFGTSPKRPTRIGRTDYRQAGCLRPRFNATSLVFSKLCQKDISVSDAPASNRTGVESGRHPSYRRSSAKVIVSATHTKEPARAGLLEVPVTIRPSLGPTRSKRARYGQWS